ncbi:MAG TPA: hypothetical protein VLF79_01800 [Candidatus Saccharimonadales bacterium]|nr:hypothetical protein [Candidatus Saccharimonadales bacterium]
MFLFRLIWPYHNSYAKKFAIAKLYRYVVVFTDLDDNRVKNTAVISKITEIIIKTTLTWCLGVAADALTGWVVEVVVPADKFTVARDEACKVIPFWLFRIDVLVPGCTLLDGAPVVNGFTLDCGLLVLDCDEELPEAESSEDMTSIVN